MPCPYNLMQLLGSRGDILGLFELTPDPLVGAMLHELQITSKMKTNRGEIYSLRKVTGVVAHDNRIYLTTLKRPTIKSITLMTNGDDTSLVVSRFAGRHFECGSFVDLRLWNQQENNFLFATEIGRNDEMAIHIHCLPHENFALTNFYVGSLIVKQVANFDSPKFLSLRFHCAVGAMKVAKPEEIEKSEKALNEAPCLLMSIRDTFHVITPSVFAKTQQDDTESDHLNFQQLELYPRPSFINMSMAAGDSDNSDLERSEDLDSSMVVVPSSRFVPGKTSTKNESVMEQIDDEDDNPPTDVDEDDEIAPPQLETNHDEVMWKKVCTIL